MAQPTRSGRIPKRKIVWEASTGPHLPQSTKKRQKKDVQVLEIAAASKEAPAAVHAAVEQQPTHFTPPIRVQNESFKVLWDEKEPIDLFLRFLGGPEALNAICVATNERASSHVPRPKNARLWTPLDHASFCHWLAVVIYMARHPEKATKSYWECLTPGKGHHLGHWMGDNRWHQIHRFFSINNQPLTQEQPYWHRLMPIASLVRKACQTAVKPSTWVAIDEGMTHFTGRSKDKVLLKNKPIPEGYKTWQLGCVGGYTWSWLFHSGRQGPEAIGDKSRSFRYYGKEHPVKLAPTYQVVQRLCQELRNRDSTTKYVAFVDNLFLTKDLAHTLLAIDIGVMGTTRKNQPGIPPRFLDIKATNEAFTYGGYSTEVVEHCLCFIWQDNAPVIGITTAFALDDDPEHFIVRTRRRARSNKVAAPIFGDKALKDLPIPVAIDEYNHTKGYVDLANQLRANLDLQIKGDKRTWRPLAYWLFSTCLVNSYLI